MSDPESYPDISSSHGLSSNRSAISFTVRQFLKNNDKLEVYNVHCEVCIVQCIVQCEVYNAVFVVQCKIFNVQCSVWCNVQYSVQFANNNVQ